MSTSTKAKVVAVGAASVLTAGVAVTWSGLAAAAAGDTTIQACASTANGAMRVLSAGESCKSSETTLTWSVTGPQGIPGVQGPLGIPGVQGIQGIQGIKGEPGAAAVAPVQTPVGVLTVAGIPGPITVLAFSWGVSNSGSAATGGSVGKANLQDISLTKRVDVASIALLKASLNGEHKATAVLTICVPTDCVATATLSYALEDVLVSSVSQGGSGTEPVTEQASLNFRKVTVTRDTVSTSFDQSIGR